MKLISLILLICLMSCSSAELDFKVTKKSVQKLDSTRKIINVSCIVKNVGSSKLIIQKSPFHSLEVFNTDEKEIIPESMIPPPQLKVFREEDEFVELAPNEEFTYTISIGLAIEDGKHCIYFSRDKYTLKNDTYKFFIKRLADDLGVAYILSKENETKPLPKNINKSEVMAKLKDLLSAN